MWTQIYHSFGYLMLLASVFFLTKDDTKSGPSVCLSSKSASVYKVVFDSDQYKNSHRS